MLNSLAKSAAIAATTASAVRTVPFASVSRLRLPLRSSSRRLQHSVTLLASVALLSRNLVTASGSAPPACPSRATDCSADTDSSQHYSSRRRSSSSPEGTMEAPSLLGPGEPTLYLPRQLYTRDQVSSNEGTAATSVGSNLSELMDYAGQTAYSVLCRRYPTASRLAVLCGHGNNGGDGYVVATLARRDGKDVLLAQVGDPKTLKGDAERAMKRYVSEGGVIQPVGDDFTIDRGSVEVIVDALFGIGLTRAVKEGHFSRAMEQANACGRPVIAIDIPSGLNADTGQVMGFGIKADATVTFVGLKQGLFTGQGPEMAGSIYYGGLGVQKAFASQVTANAMRYSYSMEVSRLLPLRPISAHKGKFGRVVLIGGDKGMPGAIRMSAEACLRTGAGLLKVVTHPDSVLAVQVGRPELMVTTELHETIKWASVMAIGPGMNDQSFSAEACKAVLDMDIPMVVDGGGLGLLAKHTPVQKRENRILTPHPGEAGQLLGSNAGEVETDRFKAVRALQQKYGGVVLLKGSGTLVCGSDQVVHVIGEGNPGMASGGMGDLLTGIITGLLAQGLKPLDAARLGASIHGAAGDSVAAQQGERGMAATDLLPYIIRLVNPVRRSAKVPWDPPHNSR